MQLALALEERLERRVPAQPLGRQSGSITEKAGGRVLLKCFAGCDTEVILERLGLDWQDVMGGRVNVRSACLGCPPGIDRKGIRMGATCAWCGERATSLVVVRESSGSATDGRFKARRQLPACPEHVGRRPSVRQTPAEPEQTNLFES